MSKLAVDLSAGSSPVASERPSVLTQGRVIFDFDRGEIECQQDSGIRRYSMNSKEGFKLAADAWLRAGWDAKYVYSFTWFGRPVIQLPDDLIRIQEVVWAVKPDVVIETGVAHGGGQVFFASLLRAIGKGRVIGVEIELRSHNRIAIEAHPMADDITIVDGSSIAPDVVADVREQIAPGDTVMVVLDANHTHDHVLAELEAYGPLVSEGSYIVATDGIMERLEGAPRSQEGWTDDNPGVAVRRFVAEHPEFELVQPFPQFNEGVAVEPVTYWPNAYLRKKPAAER